LLSALAIDRTAHERRSRRLLLAYDNLSTPPAPRSYLARTLRCAVHRRGVGRRRGQTEPARRREDRHQQAVHHIDGGRDRHHTYNVMSGAANDSDRTQTNKTTLSKRRCTRASENMTDTEHDAGPAHSNSTRTPTCERVEMNPSLRGAPVCIPPPSRAPAPRRTGVYPSSNPRASSAAQQRVPLHQPARCL